MAMHAGFALFGLLWLAIPIIVIVLVVWAVTRPRPMPPQAYGPPAAPQSPAPMSPMDILQRRFASGEISADEYQKARDLLKEPPST